MLLDLFLLTISLQGSPKGFPKSHLKFPKDSLLFKSAPQFEPKFSKKSSIDANSLSTYLSFSLSTFQFAQSSTLAHSKINLIGTRAFVLIQ